jgi:hypothetical protein
MKEKLSICFLRNYSIKIILSEIFVIENGFDFDGRFTTFSFTKSRNVMPMLNLN